MAINKENIKLFASQRLTDEDDGGGRATGNVVADGQVNNLFRDISRIDRTVGDVSMRKVFLGESAGGPAQLAGHSEGGAPAAGNW